jgi:phosphate starvation-inducible protein PhoH and related proteins
MRDGAVGAVRHARHACRDGRGRLVTERAENERDRLATRAAPPVLVDRMERRRTRVRREIPQPDRRARRAERRDADPASRERGCEREADPAVLVVQHERRRTGHGRTVSAGAAAEAPRPTLRRVQDVLTVPNEVAAELAGVGDGVLDALRERLGCSISLRGNRLTLDGDDERVVEARAVVDELVELVEGGHAIGPDTVGAVVAALDQAADIRDVFEDVVWRHRGKKIAPKTVTQKRYVDAIRASTVTFAIGPAGTGKTYLAIALAVKALSEKEVGRIILTRPAVEAGERLGFLPGDILAKVDPYMRPLFDALYDTMDADRLNAFIDRGTIEVAPLAFMRGRTLNDSFVILDEAQNTTPEQMQMFLTRLGFGSKMVVTGDITQVDLPREQASGLIHVREILRELDGVGFVEFGHEDVVRHKLVQRIVEAYKRHAEETGSARHR